MKTDGRGRGKEVFLISATDDDPSSWWGYSPPLANEPESSKSNLRRCRYIRRDKDDFEYDEFPELGPTEEMEIEGRLLDWLAGAPPRGVTVAGPLRRWWRHSGPGIRSESTSGLIPTTTLGWIPC